MRKPQFSGRKLRKLRVEAHKTQEMLARQINARGTGVALLEAGGIVPSDTTVMRLCAALRCSPNDLME